MSIPVTISTIATELARLYDLRQEMGEADWRQSQHLRELMQQAPDARPEPQTPFEILRDRANAEAEALEVLLLQQDPTNPDEGLALVCLIDTYFQNWAAQAYRDREVPDDEEKQWDQLTRALAAMARWLSRSGATSPIRHAHFGDQTMLPMEEQISRAQQRAGQLADWHKTQKEVRP